MASPGKERNPASLPAPNSDFYELVEMLPAEELATVKQVRGFMETKIAPIITKYWVEDAFPFEILPALKDLNIGGIAMQGYGCRGGLGTITEFSSEMKQTIVNGVLKEANGRSIAELERERDSMPRELLTTRSKAEAVSHAGQTPQPTRRASPKGKTRRAQKARTEDDLRSFPRPGIPILPTPNCAFSGRPILDLSRTPQSCRRHRSNAHYLWQRII